MDGLRKFFLYCFENLLQNLTGAVICTWKRIAFQKLMNFSCWKNDFGNSEGKCSQKVFSSIPSKQFLSWGLSKLETKSPFMASALFKDVSRKSRKRHTACLLTFFPSGRPWLFADDEKKVWFSHLMKSLNLEVFSSYLTLKKKLVRLCPCCYLAGWVNKTSVPPLQLR